MGKNRYFSIETSYYSFLPRQLVSCSCIIKKGYSTHACKTKICFKVIPWSFYFFKIYFLLLQAPHYTNNNSYHLFSWRGTYLTCIILSHRRILSLIMDLTCTEIIVQSRTWKKNYGSEVSVKQQESSGERRNISSQRGSFNQHSAQNYCVLLYPSLKNLTDHGQKDKETDRLDSVMSSDDCNMAIRAGSLEEEAHEPQAWKVWGASEQTRMGCTWISLYQPVL